MIWKGWGRKQRPTPKISWAIWKLHFRLMAAADMVGRGARKV